MGEAAKKLLPGNMLMGAKNVIHFLLPLIIVCLEIPDKFDKRKFN